MKLEVLTAAIRAKFKAGDEFTLAKLLRVADAELFGSRGALFVEAAGNGAEVRRRKRTDAREGMRRLVTAGGVVEEVGQSGWGARVYRVL